MLNMRDSVRLLVRALFDRTNENVGNCTIFFCSLLLYAWQFVLDEYKMFMLCTNHHPQRSFSKFQ